MLRFGIANEVSIFLAIVVLPVREQIVAATVTHFPEKLPSRLLRGAIPQWVELYTYRQASQRIVIVRTGKHRPLIAQPPHVAKKSQHQQHASAHSDTDL